MKTRLAALAIAIAIGSTGCTGPTGPRGINAPASKTFVVQLNSTGTASQLLTPTAGTDPAAVPIVACYTSATATTTGNNTWVAVGSTAGTGAACGLDHSGGVWNVVMTGGTPNYYAMFVVLF